MFDSFASILGTSHARELFMQHPSDLVALLEYSWQKRAKQQGAALGSPENRSDVQSMGNEGSGSTWMGQFFDSDPQVQVVLTIKQAIENTGNSKLCGVMWEHLIYAYMLENTRLYDIFGRVLTELLHGEKLGLAHADTLRWLRSTEQLWFSDPPAPFFLPSIVSHVRPDLGATRRNAYQRMFGMELNHGTDSGVAYPYQKSEAANNDFVSIFEEFLREVWIGMVNVNNSSGPKPTDDAKIAELATRLNNMLLSRRLYGTLSPEEFSIVSMMSWFNVTLSQNFPIIQDLRCEAASPEERLFKIAQRVGLPAHGLSKSYFEIAQPISHILILIETGNVNDVAQVPVLYTPALDPARDMHTIITHWSIVTGRDMKAGKVSPS